MAPNELTGCERTILKALEALSDELSYELVFSTDGKREGIRFTAREDWDCHGRGLMLSGWWNAVRAARWLAKTVRTLAPTAGDLMDLFCFVAQLPWTQEFEVKAVNRELKGYCPITWVGFRYAEPYWLEIETDEDEWDVPAPASITVRGTFGELTLKVDIDPDFSPD